MKRKILNTIIFLVIVSSSQAQYLTVTDTGKVWSYLDAIFGGNYISHYNHFCCDSTAGGITYRKLQRSNDSLMQNWYNVDTWYEDTTGNVYSVSQGLMYNFSLDSGDLVLMQNSQCYVRVDSVRYLNYYNVLRKTLFLTTYLSNMNQANPNVWIEGIGSPMELVYPGLYPTDTELRLLCYYENDSIKYYDNTYNTCYLNVTGLNDIENNKSFKIFPNPAHDILQVSFKGNSGNKYFLSINDITGKQIRSISIVKASGNFQMSLSLKSISQGIYAVLLSDDKGNLLSKKKLIVE